MQDTPDTKRNAPDESTLEGGPYADLIRELIASGRYDSTAEIVLEGLALVREREIARKAQQEWLKAEIQKGIDEADRGELIPADEVFASLRAEITAKAGT
jgi:antitoxin ParD1/3/4